MSNVIVKWTYNINTEINVLLFISKNIVNGFYKSKNFYLLPYSKKINDLNISTVSYPKIAVNEYSRFWQEVASKSSNASDAINAHSKEIKGFLVKKLNQINLDPPDISQTQREWAKGSAEILNVLFDMLALSPSVLKSITICPTNFGPGTSYTFSKRDRHLHINLREGANLKNLTATVLSALLHPSLKKDFNADWLQCWLLTDWLMLNSKLSTVLSKYTKTSRASNVVARTSKNYELVKESDRFYEFLGLAPSDFKFELVEDWVIVNGGKIEGITPLELRLLKLLIANIGEVVSPDSIFTHVYGENSDYSLAAIAKLIERLRTKLEKNGISSSFIETHRGFGYRLIKTSF